MSEKVKNFFDTYAPVYKKQRNFEEELSNILEMNKLVSFLNIPAGSKVIELGCGVGRCALPLLKKGYSVTGIEISKDSLSLLIERAKEKGLAERLTAKESNLNEPIYTEVFDAALCISALHLLADTPEGRKKIFANLVASVKRGGIVTVVQPNPLNPLFYIYYLFSDMASWQLERRIMKYGLFSLKKLLSESGLKEIKYDYYGMLPTRWANIFPFIYHINAFLCKIPVVRRFSAFIFIKGVR